MCLDSVIKCIVKILINICLNKTISFVGDVFNTTKHDTHRNNVDSTNMHPTAFHTANKVLINLSKGNIETRHHCSILAYSIICNFNLIYVNFVATFVV